MANFLLFGPRGSGKTQILRSYTGQSIEPEGMGTPTYNAPTAMHEEDRHFLWIHWKKIVKDSTFMEIGGRNKNIKKVIERIKEGQDEILLYVFDGTEFIKQLKEPDNGSEIYALWKYYMSECGDKLNKIHFIATHEDKKSAMRETILNLIKDTNQKYMKLIGKKRYDDILFDEHSFHCINATNKARVKEMIESIWWTYSKEWG